MENYDEQEAFEMIPCPSCGGGNEKESSSCSHCGKVLRRKRKKLFKRRSFFFGGIGLVLILAIASSSLEFRSLRRLEGQWRSDHPEEFFQRVERRKSFMKIVTEKTSSRVKKASNI